MKAVKRIESHITPAELKEEKAAVQKLYA